MKPLRSLQGDQSWKTIQCLIKSQSDYFLKGFLYALNHCQFIQRCRLWHWFSFFLHWLVSVVMRYQLVSVMNNYHLNNYSTLKDIFFCSSVNRRNQNQFQVDFDWLQLERTCLLIKTPTRTHIFLRSIIRVMSYMKLRSVVMLMTWYRFWGTLFMSTFYFWRNRTLIQKRASCYHKAKQKGFMRTLQ